MVNLVGLNKQKVKWKGYWKSGGANKTNNMKPSTTIKAMAGFYLGAAPGILWGITFTDWRWWVLVMPTVILFSIADKIQSEEEN